MNFVFSKLELLDMLTLIGKNSSKDFLEIQKKLKDLTVSYHMKYTNDKPYLQDGEIQVKGKEEIEKYIEELGEELKRWYYCSC